MKDVKFELSAAKTLDSLSHTVWYGFPELPDVEADIVNLAADTDPTTMMLMGMAINALGIECEMEEVGTDTDNGLEIEVHYHLNITKAQWKELTK